MVPHINLAIFVFFQQEYLDKSGILWEDPNIKLSALQQRQQTDTSQEDPDWQQIRISECKFSNKSQSRRSGASHVSSLIVKM